MKYMNRHTLAGEDDLGDDDPLTGVANLFDLSVVFIVGLIVTMFSAFQLLDLFNEKTDMTLIKKTSSDNLQIISKQGKKIKAVEVTKAKTEGRGERLGTAYRLDDGTMVYVPE
jgi:hypothetical protein